MFTRAFWRDALERAAKTAVQAILLAVGGGAGLDLFSLDWQRIALAAAAGAVLSILTSIASDPFGQPGTASLVAPIPDSTPAPAPATGEAQNHPVV